MTQLNAREGFNVGAPLSAPGTKEALLYAQAAEIALLKDTLARLREALDRQTERERRAGAACGVPYVVHGSDWPVAVAERVVELEGRLALRGAG